MISRAERRITGGYEAALRKGVAVCDIQLVDRLASARVSPFAMGTNRRIALPQGASHPPTFPAWRLPFALDASRPVRENVYARLYGLGFPRLGWNLPTRQITPPSATGARVNGTAFVVHSCTSMSPTRVVGGIETSCKLLAVRAHTPGFLAAGAALVGFTLGGAVSCGLSER